MRLARTCGQPVVVLLLEVVDIPEVAVDSRVSRIQGI